MTNVGAVVWHDGAIVDADAVRVGIGDRTFEHGLGLFETLRTWRGAAPLLGRHIRRLRRSAVALGIDLADVILPGDSAVSQLVEAFGLGDVVLRITTTAGHPAVGRPILWMAARPLPAPEPALLKLTTQMNVTDGRATANRHKMLNYWERRDVFEDAARAGWDDCLLGSPDGRVWEAARSSLILVWASSRVTLVTPALTGPLLPGIMREVTLEAARDAGFDVEERDVRLVELDNVDAVLIANSVKKLRPVGEVNGRTLATSSHLDLVGRLIAMVDKSLGLE